MVAENRRHSQRGVTPAPGLVIVRLARYFRWTDGGFDMNQFLTDGAVHDPTPAQLWVSDDSDALVRRLEGLAIDIVEGRAPADMANRRLLLFDMDLFLGNLAGDAAGEYIRSLLDEAQAVAPILALPQVERLLDELAGPPFLETLCNAFLEHRIAHFIGLTKQVGVRRILREEPRFAAFLTVHDFDNGVRSEQIAVTTSTASRDSADLGWLVAVQCRLQAPGPGLAALAEGGRASLPGAVDAMKRLGVQHTYLISASAGDTLLVLLSEDAAGCDETPRAAQLAEQVARRLIGRPLDQDEAVEASRMVCVVAAVP
jgi:hypothetical protein